MPVKKDKQHPRKAGTAGRKVRPTGLRSVVLDPAVLDLVAVVAFGLALVISAARGDGDGMNIAAGGLGLCLMVAAVARGKAI